MKKFLAIILTACIIATLASFSFPVTASDKSAFEIVSAKLDAKRLAVTFTFSEEVRIFNTLYIYFCTRPISKGEIKDNGTVIGHDQYPISSIEYVNPTVIDGVEYSREIVITFDKPEDESDFIFKKDDPAAPEQAGVKFIEEGISDIASDGIISAKSIATADGKGLRANTKIGDRDVCWAACDGWSDAMQARNWGYLIDFVSDDIIIESTSKALDGYYTYHVRWDKAIIVDVDSALGGNVVIPSTLGRYPLTAIGEYSFIDNFYKCDNSRRSDFN